MFSLSKTVLPIGLDLGHDSVKLVQIASMAAGPRVLAAARERVADESNVSADRRKSLLQTARRVIDMHAFSGRRVVACLPRELVHLKNIRLPLMPLDEVGAAVTFEAANAFDIDLSDAVLKHLVAGEIRQGSESRLEVMCLAVQKAEIDLFIEQTHDAGVELAGLEFEPASLFNGISRLAPSLSAQSAHLILDVGYRRSQVIIGRGEEIQFFKPIDIGSRRLTAAVARKLGITETEAAALRQQLNEKPDADAGDDAVRISIEDTTRQAITELAREVALCLRYFSVTFRGVRVKSMQIVGGEARCVLLRRLLQQELPTAIQDSPTLNFINDAAAPLQVDTWSLSTALAMRNFPAATPLLAPTPSEQWEARPAEAEVNRG